MYLNPPAILVKRKTARRLKVKYRAHGGFLVAHVTAGKRTNKTGVPGAELLVIRVMIT
jgi:hypothetical protein